MMLFRDKHFNNKIGTMTLMVKSHLPTFTGILERVKPRKPSTHKSFLQEQ